MLWLLSKRNARGLTFILAYTKIKPELYSETNETRAGLNYTIFDLIVLQTIRK